MQNGETITVGWCDNNLVSGEFTEGLLSVILQKTINFPVTSSIRVQGNQIAVQRQRLIDHWYDAIKTDWLFWLDSDIVINKEIWEKMCSIANSETHPLISGVYFISKEKNGSLNVIYPCIFNDVDEETIQYIHPLPADKVLKIDCAGMGLVLIHRSVIEKLRTKYGTDYFLFEEKNLNTQKFLGEDISFFRKCKEVNIPLYAHTGAIAKHIKYVAWDIDYYHLYWTSMGVSPLID
jgi:hypothetical protein